MISHSRRTMSSSGNFAYFINLTVQMTPIKKTAADMTGMSMYAMGRLYMSERMPQKKAMIMTVNSSAKAAVIARYAMCSLLFLARTSYILKLDLVYIENGTILADAGIGAVALFTNAHETRAYAAAHALFQRDEARRGYAAFFETRF